MPVPVLALAAVVLSAPPMRVEVDLTGAARHLVHTHVTIPAAPGPLALSFPKWIPGEHGPTGPIKDMAGLKVTAGGKDVDWSRDPRNMYKFDVVVPAGASEIAVDFDMLSTAAAEGFSSGASLSPRLAVLSWNQVVVFPAGKKGSEIDIEASVKLPAGWHIASPLGTGTPAGTNTLRFDRVSLTTLVDSPVLAGENLSWNVLDDGSKGKVDLAVAADNPAALAIPKDVHDGFVNLVREADALFGARHYRNYVFLLTVSDQVAHFGLEHHESSDDRVRERVFLDEDVRQTMLGLLPHEYVHSWNGKFRRPADLNPDDFEAPIDSNLLWVYEGLTNYLGWVLTARSGLRTTAANLDDLAMSAAELDHRAGRRWRPLEDTATAGQLLYETDDLWMSWRRQTDFYDEGTLIWLDADVTIRKLTKGAKSLDDFCKAFHGGPGGKPEVKTYRFEDVVAALQAVAPNDWASFLKDRIRRRGEGAPLGGITGGGWKLEYTSERSELQKSLEEAREQADYRYDAGFCVTEKGVVVDVVPDSPAWKAGVAPGMTVVAVDGLKFTRPRVREAVRQGKDHAATMSLILQNGESFMTVEFPISGGERYAHLVRGTGDDVLSAILAPRAGSTYNQGDKTKGR